MRALVTLPSSHGAIARLVVLVGLLFGSVPASATSIAYTDFLGPDWRQVTNTSDLTIEPMPIFVLNAPDAGAPITEDEPSRGTQVPEPATLFLFGSGVAAATVGRYRRRSQRMQSLGDLFRKYPWAV